MEATRTVWRDGVVAGLLGATGVAVWFLMVDTIAGHPLHTPALLGRAMLSVLGRGIEDHSPAFFVSAYTLFHVGAFIVIGCAASWLMNVTRRVPQFAAALALFFAVFEVGFYFLTLMLSARDILGALAWYQIGAANLVASALAGGYLLRRYPNFTTNLDRALDGSV